MSNPTIKDMLNADREVRERLRLAESKIKEHTKTRKEAVKHGKRTEAKQQAAREGKLI